MESIGKLLMNERPILHAAFEHQQIMPEHDFISPVRREMGALLSGEG
jgi:hypothetical protein